MAKNFLEVFPSLNIAEPLKELLALTEVEKVTSTRDRSSIRVYVKSPRLIHKQNIYDLEKGIKNQLFPDKQVTVKIQEKYRLSGQYTPEKLLKMYKDSLLLELKHYSIIEYTMFRKAQVAFEKENLMTLTVEDTMVNRDRTGELKRVLEKVFTERCGLPVEVQLLLCPPWEVSAENSWSRRSNGKRRLFTGRTIRKNWQQWAAFHQKVWKARDC